MDDEAEPPTGDVAQAVRARLEGEADVVLAYLVGRGGWVEPAVAPATSNVEVAVLLEPDPGDRSREAALRAALGKVVAAARLAVVVLNHATPERGYRALAQGRLLLCRDEGLRTHYAARVIECYFDMDSLRQMLATGLRHRLEQGGIGPL